MRIDLSESITRSPAEVFRFVATEHVKNHPRWDPQLTLAQESPGPIGVGTKIHRSRDRGDGRMEGEMEVTEFEQDRKMGVVIHDGPMELRSWITVEPEGNEGSVLTFSVESDDAPLNMMEGPIKGSLGRIKEMIESEA